MKKTLFILSLVMAMLGLGMTRAYAAAFPPTIDGVLGAGEWTNSNASAVPYPYYLQVGDPNEADNAFDNTDISNAVVLQELSWGSNGAPGGGDDGTLDSFPPDTVADFADDGIYILLEVYAPPPTLDWDSVVFTDPLNYGITGNPTISMQGDLLGDGLLDPFNIFIRHYNLDPGPAAGADVVEVCTGSVINCQLNSSLNWTTLASHGGTFARGSVVEYFIPSGALGTPPSPPGTPFPFSFRGKLTYDNGMGGPNTSDDIVIGQLAIPEPSTIMLTVTGLLGMLGFGKFKFWN